MLCRTKIFILAVSATTVLMFTTMAEAQVVEDGLVSYWTFDEADIDGKTVIDIWGENDGTIQGGAKGNEGKVGEALEFDGADSRVEVLNNESLALSDEFTVEAWVMVNKFVTNAAVVAKGTGSGFFALEVVDIAAAPNGWKVRINAGGNAQGQDFPDNKTGEWYHLVMVVDGRGAKGLKLYVDGELQKEPIDSSAVGVLTCPEHLYIGYEQRNNMWFNGVIDEVRIYNRALTDKEIKKNFVSQGLAVATPVIKLTLTWGAIKASR